MEGEMSRDVTLASLKRAIAGVLFLGGTVAHAQLAAVNADCNLGGKQAAVSGIQSTNYLQGIVIGCQITPYLTGTTTLASYSLTPTGPATQTGPFTANTYG